MTAIRNSGICSNLGGIDKIWYCKFHNTKFKRNAYQNSIQLLDTTEFFQIDALEFTVEYSNSLILTDLRNQTFQNRVSFKFAKNDKYLNYLYGQLLNKRLSFLFIDKNGKFWVTGLSNGYVLDENSSNFGADVRFDRNSIELVYTEIVTAQRDTINELNFFNYLKLTNEGTAQIDGIDFIQSILQLKQV